VAALFPELSGGQVLVFFQPVIGFTTPANQYVTITGGQPTAITVQYTPLVQTGSLQVAITPPEAVAAGAEWNVDGGTTWFNSGATVPNLSAGSHTVAFKPTTGWATPGSQMVQIDDGQTTLATGLYNPPAGVPLISSLSPNVGSIAGGLQVTIQGSDFAAPVLVTFGGITATNVTVISSTQITAVVPASTSYVTVPVSVTVPDGTATDANGFTYIVPRGTNLQLVGQIGGAVTTVAVQGNYAYIGEGSALAVVNVSNPSEPAILGSIPLPSVLDGIAVSGSYAYVADADSGLQIVNISNPSAPAVQGYYDLPGGTASNVVIMGSDAYVADGSNGLEIINVVNPSAPTLAAAVNTGGSAVDVATAVQNNGAFAYVMETVNGLQIVDVSTPTSPVLRGHLPMGTGRVVVQGTIAFVGNTYLTSINVSNPDAPAQLENETTDVCFDVAVSGNVAYACGYTAMDTIDVSNPSNMKHLGTAGLVIGGLTQTPEQVAVSGGLAFIALGQGGLAIVNVSNPNTFMPIAGSYSPPAAPAYTVEGAGSTAYVMDEYYLQTFNLTNPSQPVESASLSTPGAGQGVYPQQFQVVNGIAYIAGQNGLSIENISNSADPTLLATYKDPNVGFLSVEVLGGLAYIGGGYEGGVNNNAPKFDILNVSNPSSPTWDGSVTTSASGIWDQAIAIDGSYAYVIEGGGNLDVINVGNPKSPSLAGTVSTDAQPGSIAISSDAHYLFVGEAGELEVYDVSTPSSPNRIGAYSLAGGARVVGLSFAGGLVYVAASSGVDVIDPSVPTNLNLVASYDTTGSTFGVSVAGSTVYVAGGDGGLEVLSLRDYLPPTISISSPTSNSSYGTSSGTLDVNGLASDNVGVTLVVWSNSQGGGGTATGTTNWTINNIELQPGQNVITVTAMDAAGNQTNETLNVTYTPVPSNQTITFTSPGDQTFGDAPIILDATASSGLPIALSVVSGPAILSDNDILTLTGAGTVNLSASQSGNAFFNAAAAVTQSFSVSPANQIVTLTNPGPLTFGDAPFIESASASSGLMVDLNVLSGPATVSAENLVTLTGAGTVVLQGTQSGDANYNAAAPVDLTLNVGQGSQTIAFGPMSNQTVGDASFPVSATADSDLPVSFTILSGPATLSGNVITITGAGTVTIEATQTGNANYSAAEDAVQSFVVDPSPAITWTGTGDGVSWNNPNNWSNNLVPTQNDAVTIPAGATPQLGSGTYSVASLTLVENATLNLASGTLEIDYGAGTDPIATIETYVHSAYNNDTWTGSGIFSSIAAADPGLYAVGYADGNTDVGTPAAANQIIIENTLAGDANLDGTVNFADLLVVGQNFNHTLDTHGNPIDWADGDFNYDGTVNFADLLIVAQNFNKSLGTAGAVQPVNLTAPIEYVRLDANGVHADIWNNATASGPPVQTILLSDISSLTYTGPAGGDALIVDYSNGNPLPASGLTFTGGAGTNTLEVIGTTGNDSATVNGSTLSVTTPYGTSSIAYTGASTIVFDGNALGVNTLTQAAQPGGGASLVFYQPTALDTLDINGGTFTVPANSPGGDILDFTLGTVSIAAGAKLVLAASDAPADQTILAINNLTVAGMLDLTDNVVEINYMPGNDPITTIQGYLKSGYNNDTWTGTGITSSNAAADPALYAVGYAEGNLDSGTPAAANQIYIKNTLAGDANLDGTVNFADLLTVSQNFNKTNEDWAHGDFNYQGTVNFADLLLVSQNFNKQLAAGQVAQMSDSSGIPAPIAASGAPTPARSMDAPLSPTASSAAESAAIPTAPAMTTILTTASSALAVATQPPVASETSLSTPMTDLPTTSVTSSVYLLDAIRSARDSDRIDGSSGGRRRQRPASKEPPCYHSAAGVTDRRDNRGRPRRGLDHLFTREQFALLRHAGSRSLAVSRLNRYWLTFSGQQDGLGEARH
jgi:hypothetical protein